MGNRFLPRGHAESVMLENGDSIVRWVPDEAEHRERFDRAVKYAGDTAKQDLGAEISKRVARLDGGVLYRWSPHHWQVMHGDQSVLEFWTRRDGGFTWRGGGTGITERGGPEEFAVALRTMYE